MRFGEVVQEATIVADDMPIVDQQRLLDSCWKMIASNDLDKEHKPPFVSIVITAHNYAQYVASAIRSVKAQTYSHFECIIIDDASSDDTARVAEATVGSLADQRFSVTSLPKNLGQLGAQSYGLSIAKGQFVVFLDADDMLKPRFIERHLYAHLNLLSPVGFTSSNQWNIAADGTILSFHHPDFNFGWERGAKTRTIVGVNEDERHLAAVLFGPQSPDHTFRWCWATQSTMMFRRAVLDAIMPPAAEARSFRVCADYYLVRFSHLFAGSAIVGEALGSYRRHSTNNFCSNALLSAEVSTGDMRTHPDEFTFATLVLKILTVRKETFIGMLGEGRYSEIQEYFAGLRNACEPVRGAPSITAFLARFLNNRSEGPQRRRQAGGEPGNKTVSAAAKHMWRAERARSHHKRPEQSA